MGAVEKLELLLSHSLAKEQGWVKVLGNESKKLADVGLFYPFLPTPRSVNLKTKNLRFRNGFGSSVTISQAGNSNFGTDYKYHDFFLKPILYNNFHVPITFRLPSYLSEETISGKQIYHGKMDLIPMSLNSDWGSLRKCLF